MSIHVRIWGFHHLGILVMDVPTIRMMYLGCIVFISCLWKPSIWITSMFAEYDDPNPKPGLVPTMILPFFWGCLAFRQEASSQQASLGDVKRG